MKTLKRAAIVVGAITAAFVYVWVAAVRAVPDVRSRKADARARRRG